jgi:signal transduction histidine kinase
MNKNIKFDKDISCINFATIFSFLEEKNKDTKIITDTLNLSKDFLTNRREYVDLPTGIKLFELVKFILNEKDPMLFYDIGKESVRLRSLGFLIDIAESLGDTKEAIKFIPRFNQKYNNIFNMNVYNITNNSGVLIIDYLKKYDGVWIYDQCAWNKGNITGIPFKWNMPNIEIEEPLCKFTLEEIIRDYSYLNHKFKIDNNKAYLNDKEFAIKVKIGFEKLKKSKDKIEKISKFKKFDEFYDILTNLNYKIFDSDYILSDETNNGMLIIEDVKISDKLTLKAGQIFGAPYCRLNLKWQEEKNLLNKFKKFFFTKYISSTKIIKRLEEEAEENIRQKQELIKSQEQLQIANLKLTDYSNHLEDLVEQKTSEIKQNIAQLAHSDKMASVGKLSAAIAHEIKNPLSAIASSRENLKENILNYQILRKELQNSSFSIEDEKKIEDISNHIYDYFISNMSIEPELLRENAKVIEIQIKDKVKSKKKYIAKKLSEFELSKENIDEIVCLYLKSSNVIDFMSKVKEIAQDIRIIDSGCSRILSNINALESFTHLDRDIVDDINIQNGLDVTLQLHKHYFKNKIKLEKKYELNLPYVRGHPGQLNQVWDNIIKNSVQSIQDTGNIIIETYKMKDNIGIKFTDDGIGIKKEDLNKIFEPYFSTKKQGEGQGLGLHISYKIIKNHNGDIKVYSKPGIGTTFEVILPYKK